MQRHAPFLILSRVTVWLRLFESCTVGSGCQSLRGSSTSCACWFTSRFWDTRRNTSQTFWYWLPIFQVDLHYANHRVATSSCRGHVDELATEPFLLMQRHHGTGCRRRWNCCDRRTRFVVIWKYFCLILFTSSMTRIDCVMRPRSSSRGRNTSASVTVTVTAMPQRSYAIWRGPF